ncbi:MAG: response regulator transcription factor, partial [Gammaproteobacteria bacterium]|nr:response regulator transcription factor [Gammaproteobacteria bacterium]
MNILLADDHALVREGFKQVLLYLGEPSVVIHETTNYHEVFKALLVNKSIDLIVLDLAMPGMSQLEGVRKIRIDYPTIPLVVLSATEDRSVVAEALSYGISGYLLKTSTNKVLANALRLVLAGGVYLPPVLLANLGHNDLTPWIVTTAKDDIKVLTARQREIVNHIYEGKSNKQIARTLNITERTVKSHVTSVFQTL